MRSQRKRSGPTVTTSAQLRHAITTGQSRDKTSNIDPAAAPLGTDDEAAGNPPSRHEIDLAAQEELDERSCSQSTNGEIAHHHPDRRSSSAGDRHMDRRNAFCILGRSTLLPPLHHPVDTLDEAMSILGDSGRGGQGSVRDIHAVLACA